MAASTKATPQSYTRMSDIVKEPNKMLMPIHGYEDMPILPLEKTVLPLVTILPRVQIYVHVAKERCGSEPADGLTLDQSASIMLYTMEWEPQEQCLYFVLNATLRSEDRRKLKPWFSYLKLIFSALSRLPSSQQTLYRGVKMDLSKEHPRGKTFIWWGFSSCASCIEVLENDQFLGKTGTRTFYVIKCNSSKDISRHSYYRSEEEFLLLPARQFQVISCLEPASGLHIIQLKEIESPFPLLGSIGTNLHANKLSSGECEKTVSVDMYLLVSIRVSNNNLPSELKCRNNINKKMIKEERYFENQRNMSLKTEMLRDGRN
jgi:hypothetical protein